MDERGWLSGGARWRRRLVGALAGTAVLAGSLLLGHGPAAGDTEAAATATATATDGGGGGGGDQAIRDTGGGGIPWGYVRVSFSNVGDEPLVGRTTVVAEVAGGPLRFTYAAFFPLGGATGGDVISGVGPEISPDGKRLVYYLDGVNAPTVSRELRIYYTDNRPMQPSSYRVTFSHPDDVDPANDTLTFGPTP